MHLKLELSEDAGAWTWGLSFGRRTWVRLRCCRGGGTRASVILFRCVGVCNVGLTARVHVCRCEYERFRGCNTFVSGFFMTCAVATKESERRVPSDSEELHCSSKYSPRCLCEWWY